MDTYKPTRPVLAFLLNTAPVTLCFLGLILIAYDQSHTVGMRLALLAGVCVGFTLLVKHWLKIIISLMPDA